MIAESFTLDCCPICGGERWKRLWIKKSRFVINPARIVRCRDCSFVFSLDILSDEGFRLFYELKYAASNYSSYHRFSELKSKQFDDRFALIHRFIETSGSRVLDIGCGEGVSMVAAKRNGFEPTGIEISPNAVERARGKGVGEVYCCNINSILDLGLGKFDLVTMFDVFDHIQSPAATLRWLGSSVVNKGLVYAEVCDINSAYRFLMGRAYSHLVPFEHLSFFSRDTLNKVFAWNGFVPIWQGPIRRQVSLDFLDMTLQEFNPTLGRISKLMAKIVGSELSKKTLNIPVGIIGVIAQKQSVDSETESVGSAVLR